MPNAYNPLTTSEKRPTTLISGFNIREETCSQAFGIISIPPKGDRRDVVQERETKSVTAKKKATNSFSLKPSLKFLVSRYNILWTRIGQGLHTK